MGFSNSKLKTENSKLLIVGSADDGYRDAAAEAGDIGDDRLIRRQPTDDLDQTVGAAANPDLMERDHTFFDDQDLW